MTSELAQQNATADVAEINNQEGSGNQVNVAFEEITNARNEFKDNPSDYRTYIESMEGAFQNNPDMLHTIELYDSATQTSEESVLQSLGKNDGALMTALDTFAENGGNPGEGDGTVGREDVAAFLADLEKASTGGECNIAQQLAKENPDLVDVLRSHSDGFSQSSLLEEVGYGGDEIDQFNADHPASDGKPVVIKDQDGKVELVVEGDGTSSALNYDDNGNVDGVRQTRFNSKTGEIEHHSSTLDEQGQWVDENGNPSRIAAPFVDADGNFGFYTPNKENPNVYLKNVLDSATGERHFKEVDISQDDVAIAGLNRPMNVDGANSNEFKIGNLTVTSAELQPGQEVSDGGLNAQAQAAYTIGDGDNLTDIARAALGVEANYDGPEVEAAIAQLAQANGYQNLDQILAGDTLIIPPDFRL